jgi:integrase/recombinase XerD
VSEEEFIWIYKLRNNKKHQIILKLIDSCGLRCDEVCSLKKKAVTIDRKLIFAKNNRSKYRAIKPIKNLYRT